MILNYLLLIALIIFLFVDYNKAVIVLAVFAINIGFFKFSLLGSIWDFVVFIALILFFIQDDGLKIIKHPLSWCMFLPLISICLSMRSFSIRYIMEVITQYVFPVILYFSLKRTKDIRFYVKCVILLLTMASAYCFFEEMTRSNPIMEWCYKHQEDFQWMTSRIQNMEMRFGFKRSQSFFPGEAAFATVCIYSWFVILVLRNNREKIYNYILKVFLLILPLCVIFTGTRSAFLAFGIVSLGLLSWKSVKHNKLLYIYIYIAVIILFPYLSQIYDSIFYSNNANMGSSESMRETQWEIAMFYMSKNFWLGNGLGYHTMLLNSNIEGIYGLEGMWLPIMINRGMFGVLSVLSGYIIAFIYLIKKKQYSLIWVLVSFFTFKTITTVVGVDPTYYLLIIVFLIRYFENKEETKIFLETYSKKVMFSI